MLVELWWTCKRVASTQYGIFGKRALSGISGAVNKLKDVVELPVAKVVHRTTARGARAALCAAHYYADAVAKFSQLLLIIRSPCTKFKFSIS